MSDDRARHFAWADGDIQRMAPCLTCRRKSPFGPTCSAFPNGIPEEILSGDHQHRETYQGDGGLLYEPDPEATEVL